MWQEKRQNDEWRDHMIPEDHIQLEDKEFCKICNLKYCFFTDSLEDGIFYERGAQHTDSKAQRNNAKKLDFYGRYIAKHGNSIQKITGISYKNILEEAALGWSV